MTAAAAKSPIIPCLTYQAAPAAIEFLCKAFGFEKNLVVPGENDTIEHAQLTCGNAMVMVGSVKTTLYGMMMTTPERAGGSTQSIYLVVDNADAHFARAKAAGAKIVSEPMTQDYGGRDYTCQDIEGHIWSFGTYDPWAPAT